MRSRQKPILEEHASQVVFHVLRLVTKLVFLNNPTSRLEIIRFFSAEERVALEAQRRMPDEKGPFGKDPAYLYRPLRSTH